MRRVVHRVWVGGLEPRWTRPYAETWKRPGWEVCQWDDATVRSLFPLANQSLYDRAGEVAPRHVGQLRADILRYEILYRFGGVYVDHDFECLRPLDPLLRGVRCFAAWEKPGRWINNAILGAEPGHPFIAALIENLEASVEAQPGARPNRLSGPQYLTRIWRTRGLGSVRIFDKALFYPYSWNELDRGGDDFAHAYAIHHWANQRRERDRPLRARRADPERGLSGAAGARAAGSG